MYSTMTLEEARRILASPTDRKQEEVLWALIIVVRHHDASLSMPH